MLKKLNIIKSKDYDKKIKVKILNKENKKQKVDIKVFSKKTFNKYYKNEENYFLEFKKPLKEKSDILVGYDDFHFFIKKDKRFSRILNKEVGFVQLDNKNHYIVFIKRRMIIPFLIFLCFLGLLIYPFDKKEELKDSEFKVAETINEEELKKMNNKEIEELLNKKVEENMVAISLNTTLYFENGVSPKANVINSKNNKRYQEMTYFLNDGTIIAKTNLIKPGTYLKELKLNKQLKKGEYDGYVIVTTYMKNDDGSFLKTGQPAKSTMKYIVN